MSWSIGFDRNWQRDIGYGVPAFCDHPRCSAEIDRGLSYVCGGHPYGEPGGCGLYFCGRHLSAFGQLCSRCRNRKPPFMPKPDHPAWVEHKATDDSWAAWRAEQAGLTLRRGSPLTSEDARAYEARMRHLGISV